MKKINIDITMRDDVPENAFGYYFSVVKNCKKYSVVNFIWMKDDLHIKYYVDGVYASWEALDENNKMYRAESLHKLLDILPV